MLERVDTWVGKTLFVPIIIRACQWLGVSQYRVHRVLWVVAFLVAFCFAHSTVYKIIIGCVAVLICLDAASPNGDRPAVPQRWVRLLLLGFLALDAVHIDKHALVNIVALFAEYAATITTIPPLNLERRWKLADARP